MLYNTCFLVLILIIALSYGSETKNETKERPSVTTPLGKLRGYHKKSAKRNLYSAFEGIPYAKPPLGDLRFEPPEPIEPWKGIWDATSVTECAHTGLKNIEIVQGEEDCLYINVYVPHEKPNPREKLDVIVHIHGGLFMYGSPHSYAHPEYFMDENIIFVNFNYRLNILGFLSTEDSIISGNMGLKDQVLALKWIQDNIASFGGNANSVTLTGLSSGASSVHYHYLSDMSRDLFNRGYSQSGVVLNSFALQEHPLKKAQKVAQEVGCAITTTAVLAKCLKQRPFRHLLSKMPAFFAHEFLPIAPFGPVVEKGSNPFLNKHPYVLLANGKVRDLPWLTSTVSHEGFFPAIYYLNKLNTLEEEWAQLLPFLADFSDTLPESAWVVASKTLKEKYIGDEKLSPENFSKLIQLLSDRFLNDVDKAIKLQAKVNKAPVYYYNFAYPTSNNKNKTVAHGEDGQYFFYSMYQTQPTQDELKMKDLLMDMIITFAKTGKPRFGDILWKPVESSKITFPNITTFEIENISLETVDQLAPKEFWKSLGFFENENLIVTKDEL